MPKPATAVTIFAIATLLSFYGSRVWDDVLHRLYLDREAIGDIHLRLWPDEASEVLTSASQAVSDLFAAAMEVSPVYVRERLQVALENSKAVLEVALIILKASVTAAKIGRTMLHVAWKGNEHFADGFLAAFAWTVAVEVLHWIKWIANVWLAVVLLLWLAGVV